MQEGDLKQRTKNFALSIINLSNSIVNTDLGKIIKRQLLRSATAVGANTRAAFRGRSQKEFIAKLGTVIEEADESFYWLELLIEGKMINKSGTIKALMKESEELTAIFVSIKQRYKT
ncbi:MAG: four helix bundle protein [Bacteroidota bacterium]